MISLMHLPLRLSELILPTKERGARREGGGKMAPTNVFKSWKYLLKMSAEKCSWRRKAALRLTALDREMGRCCWADVRGEGGGNVRCLLGVGLGCPRQPLGWGEKE